jgi:REP element-mobilizing transposase RayT
MTNGDKAVPCLYKDKYRIESTRLKNWDYAANGGYYITICVKNRECVFGNIDDGKMILSDAGKFADQFWREIPNHFPFAVLDEFVIMPNHVHGIIVIENGDNVKTVSCKDKAMPCLYGHGTGTVSRFQNQGKGSISAIVGSYKSICTKTINKTQNKFHFAWQPRFYDHIIRDENDLNRIRKYIIDNPMNWELDENNIDNYQETNN